MITDASDPGGFKKRKPIPVNKLKEYCDMNHSDHNKRFKEEFLVRICLLTFRSFNTHLRLAVLNLVRKTTTTSFSIDIAAELNLQRSSCSVASYYTDISVSSSRLKILNHSSIVS